MFFIFHTFVCKSFAKKKNITEELNITSSQGKKSFNRFQYCGKYSTTNSIFFHTNTALIVFMLCLPQFPKQWKILAQKGQCCKLFWNRKRTKRREPHTIKGVENGRRSNQIQFKFINHVPFTPPLPSPHLPFPFFSVPTFSFLLGVSLGKQSFGRLDSDSGSTTNGAKHTSVI